ncbi:hypothetical protein I7I51_00676 [Histoplasma capsulatum]|uniref:Uncharacterized protein n=1 Tax=Ajellomyces capsulatus TaxID=5037 RepID=A0A8A1MHM4_AJECA|nr:predicted protein [Histoplasma mississippiense (nom. inval.)]EDN09020.1 predicted protein [Histoplasma mississippiense (nom. inval.)]QSS63617.1 hypothetical protein I7I51_00676 [Histoplasma capsulatum]
MASPTSTRVKESRDTKEVEDKHETESEREAREKEDVKRRLENRERAFIAASRRGDRTMEARFESALRASEVHKERTGKGLRITMEAVEKEEMYDELDDEHGRKRRCHIDSLQLRSQSLDVHLHPYMLANFAKPHANSSFSQLNGSIPNPYHTGPISPQGVYDPAMYRFNGLPGVEGMFNNPFSPPAPHGRPSSLPISPNAPSYDGQGIANFNGQNNRLNRRVASDPAIAVTHLNHAGSSPMRPESHPQKSVPSYPMMHSSQQQQQQQQWQQHLEQTRQQGNDSTRPHSNIQQLYQPVQQGSPTNQQRTSALKPAPNSRRQSYQHIQQPRPRRLNTQSRASQVIRMNSFDCMPYTHSSAVTSPAEGMGITGSYPRTGTEYNWGANTSALNSATAKNSPSGSNIENPSNHKLPSGSFQEIESQTLDPLIQCTPIPVNTKVPMIQTPCHGTSPVSRGSSAGSMTTSGSSVADPSLPSPVVKQGFSDQNALPMGLSEYVQNSIMNNNDLFPEEIVGSETSSFFQDALPDVNGLELNTASHECSDENAFLKYEYSDPFGVSTF